MPAPYLGDMLLSVAGMRGLYLLLGFWVTC